MERTESGRLLLSDEDKADFARVVGTWTVDIAPPGDGAPAWSHLREESCRILANCVQAWLLERSGGEHGR